MEISYDTGRDTGLTIKMIEANYYMPEEQVIYVKLEKDECE